MPSPLTITPLETLAGVIPLPGDKSISHRAVLMSCFSAGPTRLIGCNMGADVQASVVAVTALGIKPLPDDGGELFLMSPGLDELTCPGEPIDCGNSGTTARLLAGILAGRAGWTATLTGDTSLMGRPMQRIITPLAQMGARIESEEGRLPLTVHGAELTGIDYSVPTPSAQVKSAVLLAGLQASTPTRVTESLITRDHTERLLQYLSVINPGRLPYLQRTSATEGTSLADASGWEALLLGQHVRVERLQAPLQPMLLQIPGDASAAAFWAIAAVLHPHSEVTIPGVGLNPTRTAWLSLLPEGSFEAEQQAAELYGLERVGSIQARSGKPAPVRIGGPGELPAGAVIDELPLLALLATQADGESVISGAGELKHKESNRLTRTAELLNSLGAQIQVTEDGWIIQGPTPLSGGEVITHGDHRLAMLGAVCGLFASGPITIDDADCITVSDPEFLPGLRDLGAIER